MRPILCTALLCTTLWPAICAAQSTTGPARALEHTLSQVPYSVLTTQGTYSLSLSFHDVQAARTAGFDFTTIDFDPDAVAYDIVSDYVLGYDQSEWLDKVGFDASHIDQIVQFRAPPIRSLWINLRPGSGAAVGPALLARGYQDSNIGGQPAFVLGEEDFAIDLRDRDNGDMFRGDLDQAARVVVRGDLVTASTSTPFLADTVDGQRPVLLDQPEVQQILAALDSVEDRGVLLKAYLITDTLTLFGGSFPGDTVPVGPWTFGMLAEYSDGASATAVLAMAFVDDGSAARGAENLRTSWADFTAQSTDERVAGYTPANTSIAVSDDQARVVLFTLSDPLDPEQLEIRRSSSFNWIFNKLISREIPFLRPI